MGRKSSSPIPRHDSANHRQGEQDEDRGQGPRRVKKRKDQDIPGEAIGKEVEDTFHAGCPV